MNPYKIIDESAAQVTYEYRSIYTWVLLALAMVLGIGIAMPSKPVATVGLAALIVFYAVKFMLGRDATTRIKSAMKAGTVQISGSKYSLGNPLRIKVPKV